MPSGSPQGAPPGCDWRDGAASLNLQWLDGRHFTIGQAVHALRTLSDAVPDDEAGARSDSGLRQLLGRWPASAFDVLDLGWEMSMVAGCEGYDRAVGELLGPDFRHARALFRVAARLANMGATLVLEPSAKVPGRKRSDVRAARDGEVVHVEVKAPRHSEPAKRGAAAGDQLTNGLLQRFPHQKLLLGIDPDCLRRWCGIKEDDIRKAAVEIVIDIVVAAARDGAGPPYPDPISDMALIEGTGFELSPAFETLVPDDNRVLASLIDACSQLPSTAPGVIVLDPPLFGWNAPYLPMVFQALCRARQADCSHVLSCFEFGRAPGSQAQGYAGLKNLWGTKRCPDWVESAMCPMLPGDLVLPGAEDSKGAP